MDHNERIYREQQKRRFHLLEQRLEALETKMNILVPRAVETVIEGPCQICQRKWLVEMDHQNSVDQWVYNHSTEETIFIDDNIIPINDFCHWYRCPKTLHCGCSKICRHCVRRCGNCQNYICDNHWNNTTWSCSSC